MAGPEYALNASHIRKLLADWVERLGKEAGLVLTRRSSSESSFVLGDQKGFHILARFTDTDPYLEFVASDQTRQTLVDNLVKQATEYIRQGNLGGIVWYSTELDEIPFKASSYAAMSPLLLRLGNQTRISGWRRLAGNVLLEFQEIMPEDWHSKPQIFAPKAIVKAHLAVPGPCAGLFSSTVATHNVELVKAVCSFALGRPLQLPPAIFPTREADLPNLEARRFDDSIRNLARKGISLDIYARLSALGGIQSHQRASASLITFDAAVNQELDSVACILYVVSAEYRSGLVHGGVGANYRGISADFIHESSRRGLFSDFAEMAILRFLVAPISSVIGHPAFESGEKAGTRKGERTS